MDRLNQLRGVGETGAGRAADATLDTSSPPSEAFMSANESSKYFSLSDSTFDITPIKDVSLASAASTHEADHTMTDELIPNLSPITKKDVMLESFKIGKQIEAANILSGGVNIFDDNDNSFDGDELVIDDNVDMDDKSNLEKESQLDDNTLVDSPVDVASKDTEVVLQIDGKNVDAIDIGNGLYLYRKAGQEELAAVQIITDDKQQAPSFKFLKVRENAEGNLEVYEEFEIEVSKDVPVSDAKPIVKSTPHVPIKDISKVTSEPNKAWEKKDKTPPKEASSTSTAEDITEVKDAESKSEFNFNGKMMKFSESRKSPVVGSFTPMTYHSTPNKEGKPLTKTMVDQQLHPSRHSDNVKKTIEVHTDSQKKLATEETKKAESQVMKIVSDNIVTKETLIGHDAVKCIEITEKQDKKDLIKDDSTDVQNKVNADDSSKDKLDNIVKPTKVLIIDKPQEKKVGSATSEAIELKKSGNAGDGIVLTPKDPMETKDQMETKCIVDVQNRNMTPDNLLGTSKISEILKPNTENLSLVSSSISKKVKEVTTSNDDVNKSAAECSMPRSTTADQTLDKEREKEVKENEQKTCEDVLEAAKRSTIEQVSVNETKEATKENVKIPEKESTKILNSPFSKQTQKIEETKDSNAGDKIQSVEEDKTPVVSSISSQESTSKVLKDTEKKDKNIDELKKLESTKPVTEAVKNDQLAKATKPNTEMIPEYTNVTAQEHKTKEVSHTKPSDQSEKNCESVFKIEKSNPITKSNEPKTISQTSSNQQDKLSQDAKSIVNPVSKVDIPTTSTAGKINLSEDKIETKTVSLPNKFISVPKGVKLKIVSKTGALNPNEKKEEQTVLSQIDGEIPTAKHFKPKTYTVTSTSRGTEHRVGPKIDHVHPVIKGIELQTVSKTIPLNQVPKLVEPKISKVDKPDPNAQKIPKNKAVIITSNQIIVPSRVESLANKEINIPQVTSKLDAKALNNNHSAVPFGKWTDANRQEFLNKFKEIKVPVASNTKQIKNSNDLNRIDVLKKIDSQRSNTASAKAQDKANVKDSVFSSKIPKAETKIPVKNEGVKVIPKVVDAKNELKPEIVEPISSTLTSNVGTSDVIIPETEERREVNFNDLIGKAIVDMLNRPGPMPMTRSPLDEPRSVDREAHVTHSVANTELQNVTIDQHKLKADQEKPSTDQQKLKSNQQKLTNDQQKRNIEQKIDEDSSGSLDDIEMKMNELHGIPFVERPPHELPKVYKTYSKDVKQSKGAKKMLPALSKPSLVQNNIIDLESDEEVIEHEPITGDMDLNKKKESKLPAPVKANVSENKTVPKEIQTGPAPVKANVSDNKTASKDIQKEPVITENDFDKFVRRNSITYENCLTVKFEGKESSNVVRTIKETDPAKNNPRKDIRMDSKVPQKQTTTHFNLSKYPNTKFGAVPEDPNSKNYQSKIHTAYQSALTAKRQMDRPISIIEDKPVKVVFMDTNSEFVPNQLNVQGKELSPAKKAAIESTTIPKPVTSDATDTIEDKQQEDAKTKTKHQRKQVLNPVETPELELVQPREDVSPKKKRKTDDNKTEKTVKNLVHKKSYLLGRTVPDDKTAPEDVIAPLKETINRTEIVPERSAVSAIDSLVKAAELLENQSVQSASPSSDSQQNTPVKRGRGRPRKYPLPEGASDNKIISPSPQKKPRLIDAKPVKHDQISDEDSSDEEQMIRENWTMGKINENIVCPICNKLFRSENVVFKHVKHCTGVSPTRSDLEKRSPRRRRHSRESDNKSSGSQSEDMDFEEKSKIVKISPKKRESKESSIKSDEVDIIVIEDTPVKEQATEKEPSKSTTAEEKQAMQTTKPIKELEYTDVTKGDNKKVSEGKPIKEQTLKEIADEQLKAKQLTEKAREKLGKPKETTEEKPEKAKKFVKNSVQQSNNLVCEYCGKTFRQLSYLAHHKLQHKKEQLKKLDAKLTAKLQVFSCEVCKKEFRKLHHLVQHRLIHNPEVPTRTTRKSSSEQSENKIKELPAPKQSDDTSAGFRCEPCDKSFRKLHHLVEHRETHDGINRQKTAQTATQPTIEKPPPPPQCEVCKKTFRKLHHLSEHKEQHHAEQVETSSEKSDDKSVQSSLSTRDIIHECSLCYMVFPNEHSLNKHFVICQQKKKRQSKVKDKPQNVENGTDVVEEGTEDSMDAEDAPKIIAEEIIDDKDEKEHKIDNAAPEKVEKKRVSVKSNIEKITEEVNRVEVAEIPMPKEKVETEVKSASSKRDLPISDDSSNAKKAVPEKIKKIDDHQVKARLPKKTPTKDKITPTVTKRQKSLAPLPDLPESEPIKSNDDDDVRYMINPNFKVDDTTEGKVFMKVRSNKRNSLQIERPNSKDLVTRRTSLQHPPKIPRLKAKAVEPKVVPTVTKKIKTIAEASTDSDDSDVKYAFPETLKMQTSKMEEQKEKKVPRKSLAEKRKSLGGIAKRKSMGQGISKLKVNPSPVRIIKRRTLDVEHRCDCGQLFNSAALLTRHTSLAHTPPRIRRRRSPPPDTKARPPRKSADTEPPKTTRKSSARSEPSASNSNAKPTRKSSAKSDTPDTRKSVKPESQEKKSSAKPRRTPAHRGVPVPERMRKLMMRNAK